MRSRPAHRHPTRAALPGATYLRAALPGVTVLRAALLGATLLTSGAAAQPMSPTRRVVGMVGEPDLHLPLGPVAGPALSMRGGRPSLELFDGALTMQPVTRLDLDMGGFRGQPMAPGGQPPKYLDDTRPGVPADGLLVRRARLGLQGSLLHAFTYGFAWEFAEAPGQQIEPGRLSRLFELQLAYDGLGWITPRIGAYTLMQTIPLSASSFDRPFLETPAVIVAATSLAGGDGRWAAGGEARGERWFASFYLSGPSLGVLNDGRNRGIVGRGNGLALDAPGLMLSLGFGGAVQFAPGRRGAPDQIRLRDYPEIRLDPTRLLDTGTIAAGQGWAAGPELQALLGPLYLQAEAQAIRIAAPGGGERRFRGWYVDAAVPLVGAPRQYDRLRAVFVRPPAEPLDPLAGTWGWMELAVRWSWLSLNDAPVRGGSQGVLGVALNWFPTQRLRWTLQYQVGDVRLQPGTRASPSGADRAFQSVAARIAFNW